jgi:hypothetical protein
MESIMKSTVSSLLFCILGLFTLLVGPLVPQVPAMAQAVTRTDIDGPAGSGQFGYSLTTLPNGNWIVIDPYYDAGITADVGAVYLYDGETNMLVSTLTGSTANDRVGLNGIVILPNAKFLVLSANWSNGYSENAGAVTLCSIETGCNGVVSAANSLIGSQWDDQVGSSGITVMSKGNYIVRSARWNNGNYVDAGAVTWCSSETGCTGQVSTINSLVGGRAGDHAGSDGIVILKNRNYLVRSSEWNNDQKNDAGAVTWCSGEIGCSGVITTTNSLVGSTAFDRVGSEAILELPNDSYLVPSPAWDYDLAIHGEITRSITYTVDAGAVTWCGSEAGCRGPVTPENSLVGGTDSDRIGSGGVIGLANLNYLVVSPAWNGNRGDIKVADAGAVTFCNGDTGCTGLITAANSLEGNTNSDQAGSSGITQLVNGNYIVNTPTWDDELVPDAGAVTWCSGEIGCNGVITTTNSLVGSTIRDRVGSSGVVGLINGSYLVSSVSWDNRLTASPGQEVKSGDEVVEVLAAGLMDAGAITWCNGDTGCKGVVSADNSLVGDKTGDQVGKDGFVLLPNGNYLVRSSTWGNGKILAAGAVTWCSGETGCIGTVSTSNSLVGDSVYDKVGLRDITVLANNHYVVLSSDWDNGSVVDVGAVTWCNGETGCTGPVSTQNSLIGSKAFDRAGNGGVAGLVNGNYVVLSPDWAFRKFGAVTWCDGEAGCAGVISPENSLVGSHDYDRVGNGGIEKLVNSNYVIHSPVWNNEAIIDAGAVTWCDGQSGCAGEVSASNSLVGSSHFDMVGNGGIVSLMNGSYVVLSPRWNRGLSFDVGAATWCDGESGCTGAVSDSNSLTGARAYDRVGSGGIVELANGSHLILSLTYDNGQKPDAGAVTWCSDDSGCTGSLNDTNSLLGKIAYAGKTLAGNYNLNTGWLIITQPKGNLISLFR